MEIDLVGNDPALLPDCKPEVPVPKDAMYYDGLYYPRSEGKPWWIRDYLLKRVTDLDLAVKHVTTKCMALQAGGYVGFWPIRLAKTFERVYTFEAIPPLAACLAKNVEHLPGVIPHLGALSDNMEGAYIKYAPGGRSKADVDDMHWWRPSVTIDSLKLLRLDFLMLDIEGGELRALRGGKNTIDKWRPVIMLEIHPPQFDDIAQWVIENRYEIVTHIHSDYILCPL